MLDNKLNDVYTLYEMRYLDFEGPFQVRHTSCGVEIINPTTQTPTMFPSTKIKGTRRKSDRTGSQGGRIVGTVAEITAERERIGREIDGPGPFYVG